jgi:hypothetical protein
MPVVEAVAEGAGAVLRVTLRLMIELFWELILQGTGYLVMKRIRPAQEPGEWQCTVVGLVVWSGVLAAAYLARHAFA